MVVRVHSPFRPSASDSACAKTLPTLWGAGTKNQTGQFAHSKFCCMPAASRVSRRSEPGRIIQPAILFTGRPPQRKSQTRHLTAPVRAFCGRGANSHRFWDSDALEEILGFVISTPHFTSAGGMACRGHRRFAGAIPVVWFPVPDGVCPLWAPQTNNQSTIKSCFLKTASLRSNSVL